jgi:beta-1,4-mannosyl-glycoprotein beta-1,4-N-acetylglucosaminyltransferase
MIIDTFMFDKDFAALKIRLSELYELVDYFIISESSYTHSGIAKPLNLSKNISQFSEYLDKIIVLTDTKKYLTKNPRIREQIQRNRITKQIKKMNLKCNDLIIHSDCDEIPRASVIRKLVDEDTNAILRFTNYANFLNLSDGIWERCRVISFKYFKSIQDLRQDIFIRNAYDTRRIKWPLLWIPDFFTTRRYFLNIFPKFIRPIDLDVVTNAGWHFNNLLPPEMIITKIKNSSHIEWNTVEVRSKAIENYYQGKDIYTSKKLKFENIDDKYPACIYQNIHNWENYIFKNIN